MDTNSHRPFRNHFLAFPKGRGEEKLAFIKYSLMGESFTGEETDSARGCDLHRVTQPSRYERG